MQKQEVLMDDLLSEFFSKFYNLMTVKTMMLVVKKEDAEKFMDSIFIDNMKGYDAVYQEIAKQDMAFYLEMKKTINLIFDATKKATLEFYDAKEEKKITLD